MSTWHEEELLDACVSLRDILDCDSNPGMIGYPVEVLLQAKADIITLRATLDARDREIAELRNSGYITREQSQSLADHDHDQQAEIATLRAALDRLNDDCLRAEQERDQLKAKVEFLETMTKRCLDNGGDCYAAEVVDLRAKLANAQEREEMHSELRQETHKAALKVVSEQVDRINELQAKLAEVEQDNADLVAGIDGMIADREYFERLAREAEVRGLEKAAGIAVWHRGQLASQVYEAINAEIARLRETDQTVDMVVNVVKMQNKEPR